MGQSSSLPSPSAPPTKSLRSDPTAIPPAGCPMHQDSQSPLNPLNNIPTLAQVPALNQKIVLPLQRTISTIPRAISGSADASSCPVASGSNSVDNSSSSTSSSINGANTGKVEKKEEAWEYPSPQQFYNALVRKGWETPEESIEMMVNIHNWMNEAAWVQVRNWEEKHAGGDRSSLASFQGRPQELSPKARYHLALGKLFPSRYDYIPPFDRHDWVVQRPTSETSTSFTTHRYVIDYYSLPDDAQGNPVFSLDVRPALDSVEAVGERLGEWWKVKSAAWGGSSSSTQNSGSIPGARVQEEL